MAIIINVIFLSCQSNTDKDPTVEPYPNLDTSVKAGNINTPNPDSVKSIGSPGDDQHH
ncbi:MAG: hypothetical protein ABIP51_04255 [Bacteroidia bacterium]